MPQYRLLINGVLEAADAHFPVINPSTGQAFAQCPSISADAADRAVQAAKDAFAPWASKSMSERKQYIARAAAALNEAKDELAHLMVLEQGKPLAAAAGEVELCSECLNKMQEMELPVQTSTIDFAPASEDHRVEIRRRPIGVVAGITPWNFPCFTAVQKWAPSLVLGNTFVLKPSPQTPLTSIRMGEILKDVFPPGVFNVITASDGPEGFNLGGFLTTHPEISKISFTGSVATGKRIMAASASDVKRLTLEMGGNDAAIVRADCNIDDTAAKVFASAFGNSGQICCAIKRCFVHESIFDDFSKAIARCATEAKLVCGDGMDEGVEYGPLNNKMQFERVAGLVDDAKANGAQILAGGKPLSLDGAHAGGYFYEPTILTNVKEGIKIVDEEQFGPALPLMPYSNDEEAISRANSTRYGLGASVWSADIETANELASHMLAGTVWVNDHASLTGAPFGGFKESGIGRELGIADATTFTECQTLKLAKSRL